MRSYRKLYVSYNVFDIIVLVLWILIRTTFTNQVYIYDEKCLRLLALAESSLQEENQRMVCGNMDVEAVQESYLDDLYDNSEEKVTNTLRKGKS